MSSKFRKVKLCEILSFKTGKLDSNAAVDNGCYPFFTCSPVTLSINTHAFDTEAVLLAGNNANGVFSVKYHNGKFNAYQRTYVITPLDNSAVNVKWLYFRIKYVTSELQSMSVGTATKFLTKKILDSFEIELPTFEEQTYQAQILWALQDKLANHEAINQTLEQMAQALFKSWFVDFEPVKAKMAALEAGGSQEDATRAAMTAISGKDADALVVFAREHPEQYAELKTTAELFPSAMQDSEQGEIPEGWSLGNIKNCIDIINGYAFKSPDYTSEGVFVLRTKNFHSNHYVERLDDDVFLPRSFLKEYSKYNCEPYDYHMVMVGASIGHSAIIYPHSLPALRNQNMWCFRPKKTSFVGKAYTKTILDKIIGELKGFASGSAREFFR
ncbi:restriction endonuclease subunit S, partial [Salmonella enterica]